MALKHQLLPLAPNIKADEVTQVLKRHLAPQLQLEGQRTTSIRAWFLANLDDKLTGLWSGENQLSTNREVIVSLRKLILFSSVCICASGSCRTLFSFIC